MKPTLRAVISDQKLHGSKMATVYGSSSDNDTIRIFKQVGYGISIFFLLLTLAIYFVIKEVRTVSFHLKNEVKVQNLLKFLLNNFNMYIILGIEWKDGNVYGNHLSMFLPVPTDQNF